MSDWRRGDTGCVTGAPRRTQIRAYPTESKEREPRPKGRSRQELVASIEAAHEESERALDVVWSRIRTERSRRSLEALEALFDDE